MTLAVFVCYVCRHVYTLSPKHFCQPECDIPTAQHVDYCPRCMRTMLKYLESQFVTEEDGA